MTQKSIKLVNGPTIGKMFVAGLLALEKNRDYVDSLNVFPVPDGDTGTNMTLTMKSVVKEVEATSSTELPLIASAVSRGGLKGARGNSGVILSQILKGMMSELSKPVDSIAVGRTVRKVAHAMGVTENPPGKPLYEVGTKHFAAAIESGAKMAYRAVTVPKEGTILTVIRVMGEEAKKIAKSRTDFVGFFEELLVVGEEILSQTPEMLPVLKKAGVVDSGGRGLLIIFGGFLAAIAGKEEIQLNFENDGKAELAKDGNHPEGASNLEDLGEIEFAYCTEFNITNMHKTTTLASIDALRDRFMNMGDSVVCVGDMEMVKVHIHTNTPGEAITQALSIGEIINLKVDNMLQQNREILASKNIEQKEQGMVAVAAGEGIVTVFKDLGVDFVIKGGQTMNPSAEDIANAADRVHAKNIFVFPNNKNIILAAKHAQDLCKKNLIVIPTASINEGISAAITFDEGNSVNENTEIMIEAKNNVKSGQVTYAVRTTKLDRFAIKEGEILGMANDSIIAKGASVTEVTTKVVAKLAGEDATSITLFYGEGIREKDANALHDKLMAKYPNADVSMISGGQPVYYYLISVE